MKVKIAVVYLDGAQSYLEKMPEKARKKMLYNISLVQMGVKDDSIFKKLSHSGIWEFRVEYQKMDFRLLAFWDKFHNSIVVATHGFDKKSQKTPRKEIINAEKLREDYYKNTIKWK